MRAICGGVLWAGLAVLVLCAAAQGNDLQIPQIDPVTTWHTVSLHDDAGCVGDLRTPLCALETLLACSVRKERHLCALALGIEDAMVSNRDLDVSIKIRAPRNKLEFQFWDVQTPADLPQLPPNEIILHTRERQCAATRESCAGVLQKVHDDNICWYCRVYFNPFSYEMAHVDDHWIVQYVVYEGDVD